MADKLIICKHNDGLGYCDVFDNEYCVGSPCQHEELVEYAPVVHGEWVDDRDDPRFICGGCDKWFLVKNATGDMNFCPNCGADMRERKGDDD